jgi:3,4-dihydroxy 2-butanone 4-phosphate synthase/GTP cyclohydrolase II
MAFEHLGENGGATISLQQEGRGIGIANRATTYALQDIGMDTVDANLHLGFSKDIRQFGVVPAILEDFKICSIKFLTNNPRKVKRLLALEVDVVKETIPMVVPETNPHNHRYLETKHNRMAHTNL